MNIIHVGPMMNRFVIINRDPVSNLEEFLRLAKDFGSKFAEMFDLKYSGYMIPEGTLRKGVSWSVPTSILDKVREEMEGYDWGSYEPQLWISYRYVKESTRGKMSVSENSRFA